MHTIKSIKRNAIESAIANGCSNSTAELNAYVISYLAQQLSIAMNEIDDMEARHGPAAIQFDGCPDLLKRQAG